MLKKILKLNASDFGIIAAVVGGAFLLTELIVNIVMAIIKPNTVPTLCGVLVPCIAFMLCLFVNGCQVPVSFDFYLRFGLTRKRALGATLTLMGVETLFAFVLAWIFAQADRLGPVIWTNLRPGIGTEEFSIPLWGYALMVAGTVLLGLISGSVIQRFGRKAMWILWAGFMVFITAMNATDWDFFEPGNIPPATIILAVVLILAAVCWSVWTLLRAPVRN